MDFIFYLKWLDIKPENELNREGKSAITSPTRPEAVCRKENDGMARTLTRDLTVGKPLKLILTFATPMLFGLLFQQLYSFVDTAIVGRYLGAAKLAAVGATGSVNFLVIGLCLGFCSGFAIPVSQAFGAKNESEVRKNVWHSIVLSAVLSVVFALAATLLCKPLLRLMNTPEEILDSSASYIGIIFAAIPCCVLYNMASGILRALGDSRTPVVFLVLASLVNIALDLFLIIACGMDVAGAAVATAVSQLAAGLGCVIVMIKRFPILKMKKEDRVFSLDRARSMLGIGLPMGLQFSITAIGSVVVQWSVNGLGVNAVAGVSAAQKLSMFFFCVFDALASTMATFAGQNTGARRLDRVGQGLRAASAVGIIYSLAAGTVVFLFGNRMLGLFLDGGQNPEALEMGFLYLRFNAAAYILLLFVNIVRLCIQGMGFTRIAMLAGLAEMIARTAVALLLVPVLGFTGACCANPAAWIMADLFLIPCYFHLMKVLRGRLMPATEEYQETGAVKPVRAA